MNVVCVSAALGVPDIKHVVESNVRPLGSAGATEQLVNSWFSGRMLTAS